MQAGGELLLDVLFQCRHLLGLGRIGRNLFRLLYARDDVRIAAISDWSDPEPLEYLLRYDTLLYDQIALPKQGASAEEILLRIRQLETNYSYSVGMGFSYSFGSIFTSIVNPRFGGHSFFFF